MLRSSPLIGFVAVSDLRQAGRFYGEILGLPLRDETPVALVADANGTMLRISAVGQPITAPYTVLGWQVTDIEATVDLLTSRGVKFTRYEGMGQDERGVWTTPDGSKVAWFADPDRNTLSLTQFVDP
jgi:catechol 2,3-dioxygenase-like lactoylglutathione lyase family enzyme